MPDSVRTAGWFRPDVAWTRVVGPLDGFVVGVAREGVDGDVMRG